MTRIWLAALVTAMAVVVPDPGSAQGRRIFQPQATTVLGTDGARQPITFTRVFTQKPGELALARTEEHYVNLEPNWLKIAFMVIREAEPTVGYFNIMWGDEVVRVTCFLVRDRSDLLRGHFLVEMRATEGTIGTIPIGTVVGISEGRAFQDDGVPVIQADVRWTRGIFPDVLPTQFNIAHQLVPDLWVTGGPGRVISRHTFTSIRPPDGSAPIVHSVQEGLPIR